MAFPGAQPLGAFGNYRLLRRIARGGMAEIFLALLRGKAGFEKVVVLKRVLPELADQDEFMQIFLDEARLAARLDHPNIARVYELGEVGGQYYLAMEYLPGEDLASVIQQCRRSAKLPPIEIALEMGLAVAEGLQFAHSAADASGSPLGIVHRDVSPSNVVATYHGQVKLIDFGIARAESNLIRTGGGGKPKGKVQYMSPEQAAGRAVDARSDIFSAGVVLHELLTTQRLFRRATDHETTRAVLAADAPAPSALRPEVPPSLDRICARALALDPAKRHASARELAAELRWVLASRATGRAEENITAFMADLFPPERALKKMRISHGMPLTEESADVTPVLSFEGLTPIRTNPKRANTGPVPVPVPPPKPVAPPPPPPPPPLVAPVTAPLPSVIVSAEALLPSAPEPARRGRGVPLWVALVSAPLLVAVSFVLGTRYSGETAPSRVAVVVREAAVEPVIDAGAPEPAPEPEPAVEPEPKPAPAETEPRPAEERRGPAARPMGRIDVECDPSCEIALDGRKLNRTAPARLTVPVGRHKLRLLNPQEGLVRDVEVEVTPSGAARAFASFR